MASALQPTSGVRRRETFLVLLVVVAGCSTYVERPSATPGDHVAPQGERDALEFAAHMEWQRGHFVGSLLLLEHLCAKTAASGISDEGGSDYLIKVRTEELFTTHRYDVLAQVLRNAGYFPHTTSWIIDWWQSGMIPVTDDMAVMLRERWLRQRQNAADARKMADALSHAEPVGSETTTDGGQ